MTGSKMKRERLERALALFVCAGLTLALALAAWTSTARLARERETVELRAAAELQGRALEALLDKYRALPALLSHRADIRALFVPSARSSAAARAAGRAVALDVAGQTGAVDVAFLRPSGEPLAVARGVLGEEALATLVAVPLQGRLGRAAFATRAQGPLYGFSYPVRGASGDITGIVTVVVGLAAVEETWALALDAIHVEDAAGRFVVGNDLARRVLEGRALEGDEAGIERSLYLPRVGWRLHVVRDAGAVTAAGRAAAWLGASGGALLSGLALLALWRVQAARARTRAERAGALRLERRVRDRTRDLTREMGEREEAERRLRDAQADLAQAVKLAALGRMSAALAHEYNQPLAAIRAYAENASRLLERDRHGEVPETLARIVAVSQRMGRLAKTLRSFARRPGSATRPVRLAEAWDDALTIVAPLARERGVTIRAEGLDGLTVEAGRLRLSQVLLNLLSNAVEACAEGDERCVRVNAERGGERVRLRVSDTGPGVDPAVRDELFEPFVTTKPVGEGLGLGLSIAFNMARDFGGTLRLVEGGEGATFELTLRAATPAERLHAHAPPLDATHDEPTPA